MRYLLLALLLACSSSFAADFRFGVEIGPRVVMAPPSQVVVQQQEVVWVPPVYETRVDDEGNVYTVMVRQGYYVRQIRNVVVAAPPVFYSPCPRPTFGFSFGFGGFSHGGGHQPHGGHRR